ncbi:hypothetical protein BU26DRAFT_568720 [Trematosphaeria pertusa]|uniref:Uncharacterized protein n=1 Tax=Trematosphaeria pertusa TaxID=390896 RepID=A0A6A6I2K9_9PLEO|nr:uncharacterized protein BU26DRAFT_568720 [Trematosphaeria pertusa]KAF2244715.1 hypothetical protein BU26DRAFT_568720 [Trematosphaeria pertusa]
MQAQAGSRFLRLPGEVRNKICEHVLTGSSPIYCFKSETDEVAFNFFRSSDPGSPAEGINQMKFVCRQLRHETARLLLGPCRYLVFPFACATEASAAATCTLFLERCTAQQIDALEVVEVQEQVTRNVRSFYKKLFDLQAMGVLVEFARTHNHLTFNVILECFTSPLTCTCLSTIAGIVQLASRKRYTAPFYHYGFDRLTVDTLGRMSRKWSGYGVMAAPFPQNIKFYPAYNFETGDGWKFYNARPFQGI